MIDIKTWMNNVKYYDEPDNTGERLLVYGPSGSGKTTLLGTFPSPFVIDIDHGGKTLSAHHIPFITIPQERGAIGLVRKILLDFKDRQGIFAPSQPLADRKTIGFDGYSALADIVIWELTRMPSGDKSKTSGIYTEATGGGFKAEMDHWGALRSYLLEMTNILEDIAYRGFHVVATATAFIKENEQVRQIQGLPEVMGGFKDVILRKFDYVLYLEYENDKYLGYTKGKGLYKAKMRGAFPPIIEDPSYEKLFKGGSK